MEIQELLLGQSYLYLEAVEMSMLDVMSGNFPATGNQRQKIIKGLTDLINKIFRWIENLGI